jgi:hypothetical protein
MRKIAFLSEMGFTGKIPRSHNNMRVEFAQMCALEADHYPMASISQVQGDYDVAILLVGKTPSFRNQIFNIDVVAEAKKFAKKVLWMQEGPNWIFQDMPLPHQFWHYNLLANVDGLLVENKTDISYFKGILSDDTWIEDIPSLMITDYIKGLDEVEKEEKVIIGGNFCRWYGGFDSYICARELNVPIWAPSMGRKIEGEEQIEDINYLQYMNWIEWIKTLSTFKYGIHLMPTAGAGTFNMNCSYLGIPCIAYNELDTQYQLHPELSVNPGDVQTAKKLVKKLRDDKDFYTECSVITKELYSKYHSEKVFKADMNKKLSTLL